MEVTRTVLLLLATLSTGLMAGVFGLYAHTIMRGLARTDDRTFVRAFAAIDVAILNPWFLGCGFVGALVTQVAATLTHIGEQGLPWIASATVLYLTTVVITATVHLPSNDTLKSADHTDDEGLRAVRKQFDEGRWRRWNTVRTWLSTGAFVLLCWSLVIAG